MSNNWEDTFRSWAKGPSKSEQEKCENTERAVKKAIAAYPKLADIDLYVFAHGSYPTHTNVRHDSDVDICVLCKSFCFCDYPNGKSRKDYGMVKSDLTFASFKNLVREALVGRFGTDSVRGGNKAFDVHASTYRVDADVLPAVEHRRYTGYGLNDYISGIEFETDNGARIRNWPEQTHENGVAKNNATSRRYKSVIRILKRLRNYMQEKGHTKANDIASFLIECLVWNAPNKSFNHDRYTDDVRDVLAYTFNNTTHPDSCEKWVEVNKLEYLFRKTQPWTFVQAHGFLSAAWDYLGFK